MQHKILFNLIVLEGKVAISDAKRIWLKSFANNVTENINHSSTFSDVLEKILDFIITSEKRCDEKFVPTQIVNSLKNVIGSNFMTKMSAKYHYRDIRVVRVLLNNGFLALVESLKDSYSGSKRFCSSHFERI